MTTIIHINKHVIGKGRPHWKGTAEVSSHDYLYDSSVYGRRTTEPEVDGDTETSLSLIRHAATELLKLIDLHSKFDSEVKRRIADGREYLVYAIAEMPEAE